VITSAALLLAMVVLSSNVHDIFRPKKTVRVRFERVEGIEQNSMVKQVGRLVGKVTKIDVSRQDGNKIVLSLHIMADTIVKRDSEISIKSPLMGERYVDIGLGTPNSPPLMENDILDGRESLKVDELTDTIVNVVEDIKSITQDIKSVTGDPEFQANLHKTVANLHEASGRINDIVKHNSGNIDSTLQNLKQVAEQLTGTAGQLDRFSRDLNRVVAENRQNIHSTIQNLRDAPPQIVEQFENVQKSMSGPLDDNREDLRKIIQNLEKITQNLIEMTDELKQKPYRLIRK
jgi:ABC-type transporter Mla subunit MlaD